MAEVIATTTSTQTRTVESEMATQVLLPPEVDECSRLVERDRKRFYDDLSHFLFFIEDGYTYSRLELREHIQQQLRWVGEKGVTTEQCDGTVFSPSWKAIAPRRWEGLCRRGDDLVDHFLESPMFVRDFTATSRQKECMLTLEPFEDPVFLPAAGRAYSSAALLRAIHASTARGDPLRLGGVTLHSEDVASMYTIRYRGFYHSQSQYDSVKHYLRRDAACVYADFDAATALRRNLPAFCGWMRSKVKPLERYSVTHPSVWIMNEVDRVDADDLVAAYEQARGDAETPSQALCLFRDLVIEGEDAQHFFAHTKTWFRGRRIDGVCTFLNCIFRAIVFPPSLVPYKFASCQFENCTFRGARDLRAPRAVFAGTTTLQFVHASNVDANIETCERMSEFCINVADSGAAVPPVRNSIVVNATAVPPRTGCGCFRDERSSGVAPLRPATLL